MGRPARFDTITSCARLSVRDLTRRRLDQDGNSSTFGFQGGGEHYVVMVEGGENAVVLSKGEVRTRVSLERVPMRFGGSRVWLRCPSCGARRWQMFLTSRSWACRSCAHLVYPSSREGRHSRLGRKLEKRLRKLGSGWTLDFKSIDKPRRQRWATYWKLRGEVADLEVQRWGAFMGTVSQRWGGLAGLKQACRVQK